MPRTLYLRIVRISQLSSFLSSLSWLIICLTGNSFAKGRMRFTLVGGITEEGISLCG